MAQRRQEAAFDYNPWDPEPADYSKYADWRRSTDVEDRRGQEYIPDQPDEAKDPYEWRRYSLEDLLPFLRETNDPLMQALGFNDIRNKPPEVLSYSEALQRMKQKR